MSNPVETKKRSPRNKTKAERDPVPEEFTIQRMANIARDYCMQCRGLEYDHSHLSRPGVTVRCVTSECESPSMAKAIFAVGRDGKLNGFVVIKIVDFEFKRWWAPEGLTAKYYLEYGGGSAPATESKTSAQGSRR